MKLAAIVLTIFLSLAVQAKTKYGKWSNRKAAPSGNSNLAALQFVSKLKHSQAMESRHENQNEVDRQKQELDITEYWTHEYIESPQNDRENVMCYVGQGKDYRGFKATTKSGRKCQPWKNNPGKTNHWLPSSFPELTYNYCRNPGPGPGSQREPWCYWSSTFGIKGREYCGVPKCQEFCTAYPRATCYKEEAYGCLPSSKFVPGTTWGYCWSSCTTKDKKIGWTYLYKPGTKKKDYVGCDPKQKNINLQCIKTEAEAERGTCNPAIYEGPYPGPV